MDTVKRKRLGGRFQDMTGQQFEKWTVLRCVDRGGTNGKAQWLCRCQCGIEKIVQSTDLRKGKSKGCPKCKGGPLAKRFEIFVVRGERCWEWLGMKGSNGYAMLYHRGRNLLGHRVSYELNVGPIPEGMFVCHHCDNPGCVRPDHLFVGTHQDNMDDMVSKGRASWQKRSTP